VAAEGFGRCGLDCLIVHVEIVECAGVRLRRGRPRARLACARCLPARPRKRRRRIDALRRLTRLRPTLNGRRALRRRHGLRFVCFLLVRAPAEQIAHLAHQIAY
jgi:hypothetical protein